MSDVAPVAPPRGPVTSHIATTEWQSFELRMRHRRAQRCLLRAEIALEAGFPDDAREALEEARRVGAAPEEVARIEAQIEETRRLGAASQDVAIIDAQIAGAGVHAPAVIEETDAPQRLSWAFVATAIIVMALAAALAGVVVLRQPSNLFYSFTPAEPSPQVLADPGAPAPEPTPPPPNTVQNVPAASTDGRVLGTAGADPAARAIAETHEVAETGGTPAVSAREPVEAIVMQRETVAAPVTTSAPREAPPAPIPAASPAPASPAMSDTVAPRAPSVSAPAVLRPNVDPVPDLAAPPPSAPPVPSTPINTAASAAVPPPTTAAPSAPVRDESADVRAVLTRYESAYSRLDPSQARAVWPGVDERALSRAFNSLSSQRVSLGRCDVALNGATARATCAGSATWTPKVGGGGPRTEARRWTFDLTKSGDEWKIEKALVR